MITRREGAVEASTSHLGWQLHIDGSFINYYSTKIEAENAAQLLIYGEI